MARKDEMLKAFLKNKDFTDNYEIPDLDDLSIINALKSESKHLVSLARIIQRFDDANTTPLYQQVINELNNKL